jgi:putative endonuclease
MKHYVYVLKSKKDGNLYVGYTKDLAERLKRHRNGMVYSTKNRRPFELVYYEVSFNIEDAIRREKYLKSTYGRRYIKNRIRNQHKGMDI